MLDDVVALLACGVCGRDLDRVGGALRCTAGHAFDIARQGYAHLASGRPAALGDTSAMVAARSDFLAAGHYAPLTAALAQACAELAPDARAVLDVGAGPGHHLRAVLERLDGAVGIALDASVPAARRAARAHPRIGAVVADVWRGLPVRSGAVALLLDVFAPRNADEFSRVLAPAGALLVVAPGSGHLAELVGALGLLTVEPGKTERLDARLAGRFILARRREIVVPLRLTRPEVSALAGMGPSAWHARPRELARDVARLPELTQVTGIFTLSGYRRI